MNIHHKVQAALSTYHTLDVTHPLYAAYSDWLYARTHEDMPTRCTMLRRVCRELRFEAVFADCADGRESEAA